ncbi:hypothetical protein KEM54_000100 [Ascosphaera aggregata]|nr:hypothetical protein KEM54_000100 [Ascosphaera aggregata]
MDNDYSFEYGLSIAEIQQMWDSDMYRLMFCVLLLNFVAFVLISVDKRSGKCLRDKIITKEEIIYRAACAALCAPAACLASRLAALQDSQFMYLAGFDGFLAATYAIWAGYSAGMRKIKLDELQSRYPDLEASASGRLKGS